MRKPKYPRMSCEMNRRKKICNDDEKIIQKLYSQGTKLIEIAKKFNVNISTIYIHTHPKALKKQREYQKKYHRNRYHNDSDFRDRIKKQTAKNILRRFHSDPVFHKFVYSNRNYYKQRENNDQ